MTLADAVKAELVRDLRGGHRVREILLVRENEQDGVAELILEAAEWGEGGGDASGDGSDQILSDLARGLLARS
jgi:hypothetical protein